MDMGQNRVTPAIGRPQKYRNIIALLDPDALYCASSIARFFQAKGLLAAYTDENVDDKLAMQRIRIAMGRVREWLPDTGDGIISIERQRPTPAWYGWRWQKAYLTY